MPKPTPRSSKQTKAKAKPAPAAKSSKAKLSAETSSTSKLVVTILSDCTLVNNQQLDPPHVSKSEGGGFPHQVYFDAVVAGWVCLPPGVFTVDPVNPVSVIAGTAAGPFIVNPHTTAKQISFSHSCDQPCAKNGKDGNGDVIIINA